jgi:alkanesulfonate monooxygenase SsuD/methylene tetrahydromethanopterin reductase-like flavin-dependent oxidoreductase (luciferase family)
MMKYGLDVSTVGSYADPRILADLAVDAEEAGWDGFFIWDVLFGENNVDHPVADPWVALAAIAAKTQRIRIGALVTPLARRRPWQVAREATTLDILSNGRLVFGAGLGFQALDYEAFGEQADPKIRAERLDEALEVLAGLWTGETFHFNGKHFQVIGARLLPKAIQSPRIPIWSAGYWPNPRPFRRAARWDGVYVGALMTNGEPPTPGDVEEIAIFLKSQQSHSGVIDIAVSGETPPNLEKCAEITRQFYEAGATWWIELINDHVGSLEEMSVRIRNGPPSL